MRADRADQEDLSLLYRGGLSRASALAYIGSANTEVDA
jgi:hypothetical protein